MNVHPAIHPMIAAAAVTPDEAVIQFDGESIVAPVDAIDPATVELACNDHGCCLIPNDGNPHNDIILHPNDASCGSQCTLDSHGLPHGDMVMHGQQQP